MRDRLPPRLLPAACYLGAAPLVSLVGAGRADAFVRHHRAQALAIFASLLLLLLLGLTGLLIWSYLFVYQADLFVLDLTLLVMRSSVVLLLFGLATWALIWLLGIGLALGGSVARPPLVRGERSRAVQRVALVSNCLLLVMIPLLGAVSIHASYLARSDAAPAAVYVLFDPRGFEVFGTWGPRLVSYPVALAATARGGRGSVVVAPIDRQRLGQAFRHGRFVVLLTHGQNGMIVTSNFALVVPGVYGTKWREPGRYLYVMSRESDERLEVGDNLQLLYASACNSGPQTSEWQRRLAPAEVITFDRFSGGLEHLWWLLAHGPARLKAIR